MMIKRIEINNKSIVKTNAYFLIFTMPLEMLLFFISSREYVKLRV